MTRTAQTTNVTLLLVLAALASMAQPAPAPPRQTEDDEYTRYELLAPDSAQFRIVYDVTATDAGARYYFNAIRRGSVASDESVVDLPTGAPLRFEIVGGGDARRAGHPAADPETSYIKVHLARPVPDGGEARLRIFKTYQDPKSYYREGDLIVFARSLGIKRNAVVLPAGYELVACNVPSQILAADAGRVMISFINTSPAAAPLVVKARPVRASGGSPEPTPSAQARGVSERGWGPASAERSRASPAQSAPSVPSETSRLTERAWQDREIVYFLDQPETHRFRLYHDYTESREGSETYLNVVRQGSTVSDPSARMLDSGETLRTEIFKGEAIARAGIDSGEPVRADSEVVVVRFPAVKKGQSVRLRIEETYTDPGRYGLRGDELVWDRSFGRPHNVVILPAGWFVTASSIPATVTETTDGRIRLEYVNPRPDSIDVLLKAKRRP